MTFFLLSTCRKASQARKYADHDDNFQFLPSSKPLTFVRKNFIIVIELPLIVTKFNMRWLQSAPQAKKFWNCSFFEKFSSECLIFPLFKKSGSLIVAYYSKRAQTLHSWFPSCNSAILQSLLYRKRSAWTRPIFGQNFSQGSLTSSNENVERSDLSVSGGSF